MTNARQPSSRDSKSDMALSALADLLATAARDGFYGTAALTVSLQDGHIQHVKVATERMLK